MPRNMLPRHFYIKTVTKSVICEERSWCHEGYFSGPGRGWSLGSMAESSSTTPQSSSNLAWGNIFNQNIISMAISLKGRYSYIIIRRKISEFGLACFFQGCAIQGIWLERRSNGNCHCQKDTSLWMMSRICQQNIFWSNRRIFQLWTSKSSRRDILLTNRRMRRRRWRGEQASVRRRLEKAKWKVMEKAGKWK